MYFLGMFGFIVFSCTVASVLCADAAIDKNCTTNDKLNAAAVNCKNNFPDAACEVLFGASSKPGGDRDAKCFVADNEGIKQIAIASCPKTCGFCCETPAYKCKNKDQPRIKCDTVSEKQCTDATWRQILAEDCPSSCGLCLEGGCVDKAIACANDPTICRHVDMQMFVKENCQKTCGFCPLGTNSTSNPTTCTEVKDSSPHCDSWVKNGFCSNSFYTSEQKKQFCAKSCNLC